MKKIAMLLLFICCLATTQAQSGKPKSINQILITYQKIAIQYLEENLKKKYPKPTSDELDNIAFKRTLALANFEGIRFETGDKFKVESETNLQVVKDFIESNYKKNFSDLSEDFYKKVTDELLK
jgi:hypothetical protein